MSETDIMAYLKANKLFGGVFANDELKKPQKDKIYVLNLENSNEGGSHWVALYNRMYFDSYGCAPSKKIAPFVEQYNTDDFQGLSKESCGYFALYVADNITAGRDPYYGMRPNEPQWNEDVLKRWFY